MQSAVSPNCIRQAVRRPQAPGNYLRPAECNSAIQQIANLRYAEQPGPVAVVDGPGRKRIFPVQTDARRRYI